MVGRAYREYRLRDYSPWLRDRISDPGNWETIRRCILGSKTCDKIRYWTPLDYMQRDMSPVQVPLFSLTSLLLRLLVLDVHIFDSHITRKSF